MGAATVIHWFNPVVWIFSRKFTEISEYACDWKTASFLDEEQREGYARLLIGMSGERKPQQLMISMSEGDYETIKRRLYYIMKSGSGKIWPESCSPCQ